MPLTVAQILQQSAERLSVFSETPRLDAELLLARALRISRATLLSRMQEVVEDTAFFDTLLARRLAFEPLAYIFGEWEFYGRSFLVRPPLLTPRPETEHLIEVGLAFLSEKEMPCRIIDVGCGTGCIAVTLACEAPRHEVFALDIRPDAAALTKMNARQHRAEISVLRSDLLAAFPGNTPLFDLIVSNPPYVPEDEWSRLSPVITRHEDPGALLAGRDGLDIYRRLIPQAKTLLLPGGALVLETAEDQHPPLKALLSKSGFVEIRSFSDLAGFDRILSARCPL